MASPPPAAALDEAADAARELEAATAALRELGYAYNAADELRSVDGDAPFKFEGQPHYEKLALGVAAYVQALLRARHGLRRRFVDGVDVYASPDADTASGLVVLLCGAGAVAAGQWARRLCINESLTTGTVMPYVEWAKAQGLGVLVLNPNHRDAGGRSEGHTVAAWDACVAPAAAAHVACVAHSYGGVCVGALLKARGDAATARLRCVALTDSVHGKSVETLPPAQRAFFAEQCVNWVTRSKPLDTPVRDAVNSPPEGADADADSAEDSDSALSCSSGGEEEVGVAPKRCVLRRAACVLPLMLLWPARTLRSKRRSRWAPPWCDAARVSAGCTEHESTSESCRPSACAFLLRHLRAAGWVPPVADGPLADAAAQPAGADAPPVAAAQPAAADDGGGAAAA